MLKCFGFVSLAIVAVTTSGLAVHWSPTREQPAGRGIASPILLAAAVAPDSAELFQRHCAACHGSRGKGDGPAAVAFNPRPADLTNPEQMGQMNDEELVEVIAEGRRAMPGFGTILTPEELRSVVVYVRSLSAERASRRPAVSEG